MGDDRSERARRSARGRERTSIINAAAAAAARRNSARRGARPNKAPPPRPPRTSSPPSCTAACLRANCSKSAAALVTRPRYCAASASPISRARSRRNERVDVSPPRAVSPHRRRRRACAARTLRGGGGARGGPQDLTVRWLMAALDLLQVPHDGLEPRLQHLHRGPEPVRVRAASAWRRLSLRRTRARRGPRRRAPPPPSRPRTRFRERQTRCSPLCVTRTASRGATNARSSFSPRRPPPRQGSKSRNTGFSLRCASDRWMGASLSVSTPAPVAYHPTSSNLGNTCLYRASWSERYEASSPARPSRRRASWPPRRMCRSQPRACPSEPEQAPHDAFHGASPGSSCAATRVWWSDTLMSTRGCSLYASIAVTAPSQGRTPARTELASSPRALLVRNRRARN